MDEHIWIIGGLGYQHQRAGTIPVYRLDLHNYRIERVTTVGDVLPRLYKHQAELVEDAIIVQKGQLSDKMVNMETYRLHLPTLIWTRSVV